MQHSPETLRLFAVAASEHGFEGVVLDIDEQHPDYTSEEVRIIRLTRKKVHSPSGQTPDSTANSSDTALSLTPKKVLSPSEKPPHSTVNSTKGQTPHSHSTANSSDTPRSADTQRVSSSEHVPHSTANTGDTPRSADTQRVRPSEHVPPSTANTSNTPRSVDTQSAGPASTGPRRTAIEGNQTVRDSEAGRAVGKPGRQAGVVAQAGVNTAASSGGLEQRPKR